MNKVVEYLQGKKTYIFAVLVGLTSAFQFLGILDPETALTLYGLFGAGAVASLRSGLN